MRYQVTLLIPVLGLILSSSSLFVLGESIAPESKVFESNPNVVVMIGDGMGPEEVKLASLVEYGGEKLSIMDTDFPIKSLYNTTNINGETTDSAAGGTAISTGQLTSNQRIAMDKDATHNYKTILEYLRDDFGYATGLVTTTEAAHATPAVFASHNDKRYHYDDIFAEMIKQKLDVYLAGGLNASYLHSGNISYTREIGEKNGFDVAVNRDELLNLASTSDRVFGAFMSEGSDIPNMPFELDRDPAVEPSIIEMSSAALDIFSRKDTPFFLMIEGGRIDHAGHRLFNTPELSRDKTIKNAMETIMFEKSVRKVLDWAKTDGNTIVVVVADHETGGLQVHDYSALNSTLPSDSLSRDENNAIRVARINSINVTWQSTAHTNTPVTFYGYGSDFGGYQIRHIDDVFWAINTALGNFPTVPDYQYSFINDTVTVTLTVRDLDKSVSGAIVYLVEDNDPTASYTFDVKMNQTAEHLIFSAAVINGADHFVYVEIVDQGYNNVMVFSNKNTLKANHVTYKTPVSTSSTTILSSTDETSTDSTPYLIIEISLLFISVIYVYKKRLSIKDIQR